MDVKDERRRTAVVRTRHDLFHVRTRLVLATVSLLTMQQGFRVLWRDKSTFPFDSSGMPEIAHSRVIAKEMGFETSREPFFKCFRWRIDDAIADEWWTHNPAARMDIENTTHHCYSPIQDDEELSFILGLYQIQFPGTTSHDCNASQTVYLRQSGWGAAFSLVIEELMQAKRSKKPILFTSGHMGWRYAVNLDGSSPTCPTKDMRCYFLNTSSCQDYANHSLGKKSPRPKKLIPKRLWADSTKQTGWIYDFATRPRAWLRYAIYNTIHETTSQSHSRDVSVQHDEPSSQRNSTRSISHLSQPCAVFHVRRADVVLVTHTQVRRYHSISEYVEAAASSPNAVQLFRSDTSTSVNGPRGIRSAPNATVLLLTDDQNAIEEAETEFPNIHWIYFDRKRHHGAEGGRQNHIPSNDPKLEVIIILSTFRLVSRCATLVHSTSTFAKHLVHAGKNGRREETTGDQHSTMMSIVNMDENRTDIYDTANRATANISDLFDNRNRSSME